MGTQWFNLSALLEKSGQEGGFLLQWCVTGSGDMMFLSISFSFGPLAILMISK